MPDEELTLLYSHKSLDPARSWTAIRNLLEANRLQSGEWTLYGEAISIAEVPKHLPARRSFLMKSSGSTIHQGSVANHQHDFLSVRLADSRGIDWQEWVDGLIPVGEFLFAWLVDSEYDFWQNAQDPLQYQARGRDCSHLPMTSNGLPPPLQQMIIDTSGNPGRRVLRRGFVEVVGSRMWLGPRFWGLTGAMKAEVIAYPDASVKESAAYILVTIDDESARAAEGESTYRREELRALLFATASQA